MLKRKVFEEDEYCKRRVVILSEVYFKHNNKLHSAYIANDVAMFLEKNNITNLFDACQAVKQFPDSPSYSILCDMLNRLG